MKQPLKQLAALTMAILILWVGNGYGVFEHSCEEHGKHQHILSNWVQTSCEHEHHHDLESHDHQYSDSGFYTSHDDEQVSFVHFDAETLSKTSSVSVVISPFFQATLPLLFAFQAIDSSSEIRTSFSPSPVFRRTFGRSLLVWVQSFLI